VIPTERVDLAPFVVCPETLGPLEPVDGGYWSPLARRLYSVRRGLLFLAYPERDATETRAAMAEEHAWQGTGDVAARNLAFLRESAPQAVDFINALLPHVGGGGRRPRALELGCGNGWLSWLLAEAGLDVWMCDFEPNSLATGLNLEHPNIGEGRRFVTDARYAPFSSGSLDLVVCKEFVHHVRDRRVLFAEANRVLRPGGVLAILEPVRSLWSTLWEARHPDPHQSHAVAWPDAYLLGIRRAGFRFCHRAVVHQRRQGGRRLVARVRRRAAAAVNDEHPAGDWFTALHLRLIGGAELLVVARKARELPAADRPAMLPIDPESLVLRKDELASYAEFPAVLREAASRLRR
jgi:SAM-dependent methyltransferase